MRKFWFFSGFALVFFTAVAFATLFGYTKYRALGYHQQDFPYYFQFAIHVFDDRYDPFIAVNPEGANVFGLGGADGSRYFHDALHMEFMKYINGAVIRVFDAPTVLFFFIPIVYFLPLLYLYRIFKDQGNNERRLALLLGILYVFWPASLLAHGFDLRPFVYLTPILFSLLLASYTRQKDWHVILFFNLLFFVREEALCFTLLFFFAYLWSYRKELATKKKAILALSASYAVWALIVAMYYVVQDLPDVADPWARIIRLSPLLGVAFVFGLVFAGALWYFHKKDRNVSVLIEILFPLLIVFPFVAKFSSFTHPGSVFTQLLFTPRPGLLAAPIATVVYLLYRFVENKKMFLRGVTAFAVVVVVLSLFPPGSPVRALSGYRKQGQELALVWRWHDRLDRFENRVITDFMTYQAFADFNRVLVYERLPWFMTHSRTLWNFPENASVLAAVMPEYDYVIIAAENTSEVEEFVENHNIRIEKVEGNDRVSVYAINR